MKLRSCKRPKARGGRILDVFAEEKRRDATQMRDFTTGINPFGAPGAGARTRAEPGGFAASVASREGMETLPGFPSQSTSPPPFRVAIPACLGTPLGGAFVVNNAG